MRCLFYNDKLTELKTLSISTGIQVVYHWIIINYDSINQFKI